MKITMRVTAAGPAGVKQSGRTYEVPDSEGAELVKGGYASVAPSVVKAEPKAAAPAAKPAPGRDYVPAPEPEEEKISKVKSKSR